MAHTSGAVGAQNITQNGFTTLLKDPVGFQLTINELVRRYQDQRIDKIAAIGIRVSEGVTMHGFSLNVNNSLEAYRGIIACGIRDAGVTTMNLVTGKNLTVDDVLPHVVSVFTKHFEDSYANA